MGSEPAHGAVQIVRLAYVEYGLRQGVGAQKMGDPALPPLQVTDLAVTGPLSVTVLSVKW